MFSSSISECLSVYSALQLLIYNSQSVSTAIYLLTWGAKSLTLLLCLQSLRMMVRVVHIMSCKPCKEKHSTENPQFSRFLFLKVEKHKSSSRNLIFRTEKFERSKVVLYFLAVMICATRCLDYCKAIFCHKEYYNN